jgi:hypothetical protein
MPIQTTFDAGNVARRSKVKLETAAREVLQDLALEVVKRTPVDTGFLRGNWQVSVNVPPPSRLVDQGQAEVAYAGSSKFPPVAPQTVARVSSEMSRFDVGDTVYFFNNARYAAVIENGNATRRPRAMVRGAVANLPNIAERTIRRIKRIKASFGV